MRNRLPSLGAPLAALRQCKPEQGDILGSPPGAPRTATIIVSLSIAAIVALSLWYLVQSQPRLLQGRSMRRAWTSRRESTVGW
jgi:hypothetical protein